MTQFAQRKIKTGDNAPNFRVKLGSLELVPGQDADTLLKSATVNYPVGDGMSECIINTSVPLHGFQNSEVVVRMGYGGYTEPYFFGRLHAPDPDERAVSYTAAAYGPYKAMSGQQLGVDIDFSGWAPEEVYFELVKRAGYRRGAAVIDSASSFPLAPGSALYSLDTALSAVAQSVAESAGDVINDMPNGARHFRPRPRAGATGRADVEYYPAHYENFKARSAVRNLYSAVMVWRRNEGGGFAFEPVFYDVHTESRQKPYSNAFYPIPDFLGTEEEALEEAERTAKLIQNGMFDIEMTGIGANTEIRPHSTIWSRQTEQRYGGGRTTDPWQVDYSWQVDGTISAQLDASGMKMGVSGTGLLLREKALPKPIYVTDRRRSPYLVRAG